MDSVGRASSEQFSSQVGKGICGPSAGVCGDYMGTYDVLREALGFDLEDEYFEE